MIKMLELSVLSPDLWGGERDWRLTLANGQWSNQSCLCDEASIKTPKNNVQNASGLKNTWRCRENGAAGEGTKAPHLLLIPCSMHLFHLAVPELYPFIINCWSSNMFLWVLWVTLANFTKGGVYGNLIFITSQSKYWWQCGLMTGIWSGDGGKSCMT